MRIEVTQEDIDCGSRGNAERCAIALATRRARPDARLVSVDGYDVELEFERETWAVRLPREAREFVERYDDGERELAPLAFDLDIDGEYARRTA